MMTLPIETTRTAAWKPPTLTKSFARTVAKRLDKHWAQTGVKSLQDIRDALGSGIVAGMSMADRIDNQAAVKKWKESLSKDDLHKMFRMIEEIKNGKGREQYRTTDDALAKLRAASDDLLPSEVVRSARFPEGEKMTVEEVAKVVGPEFEDMHENPPESVKKKRKEMEEAMGEDHVWDQGFTALLPSERHASEQVAAREVSVKDAEKVLQKQHGILVKALNDANNAVAALSQLNATNALAKGKTGPLLDKMIKGIREAASHANSLHHFARHLHKYESGVLRGASEQEAEKLEAEAEANEQQADADRAKAEAAQMRTAAKPSGLYGYTKGTQRDVEASVRKAQRRAASVAKALYARDERSVSFLQAHAKRANSKSARLLLAAMRNLGPKVATTKSAALELPSERRASVFHGSLKEQLEYVVDALRLAGKQGLRVQELPRQGALEAQKKGFAEAERGQLFITSKGKGVRLASEEKIAGGLYGHPTKTARLALVACSDLRAYVGEVAFSLHSRRTAKYAKMTGFLKEHSKKTRCAYSRMLLDCYPDAPVAKQAATPGAVVEAIQGGIANVRSQAGLSMSDDEDDPVETSEEPGKTASSEIDREIKSQSQGKSAADKKKVAPHMYVISKQGGRFMITRGDPKRSGSKMVFRSDDDRDVRDWLDDNKRKISKDHMIDLTGKFDIPAEYSDFYMKTQGKKAADQMLRKAFVPDSTGLIEWEDGTRTATGKSQFIDPIKDTSDKDLRAYLASHSAPPRDRMGKALYDAAKAELERRGKKATGKDRRA